MTKLNIGRRISFYTSDEAKDKIDKIIAHLESEGIPPTKANIFRFMLLASETTIYLRHGGTNYP